MPADLVSGSKSSNPQHSNKDDKSCFSVFLLGRGSEQDETWFALKQQTLYQYCAILNLVLLLVILIYMSFVCYSTTRKL